MAISETRSLKKCKPFRSGARARKGERKLCARLVVKVVARVILSSVVGRCNHRACCLEA